MPSAETSCQKMPCHAQIVMPSAGGDATDLIQELLISYEPLIGLCQRRLLDLLWQVVVLTPKFEQMRDAGGGSR